MSLTFEQIYRMGGTRMAPDDLRLLDRLVREERPERVLEIGAGGGCSAMAITAALRANGHGHLWSVDPKREPRWTVNLRQIRTLSLTTAIDAASPWCGSDWLDGPLDMLLIDGDHRTAWALTDWVYWCPSLRVGGLVAWHDWCGMRGVWAWIRQAVEIARREGNLREVARTYAPKYGLIVFRKTGEMPPCPQWPDPPESLPPEEPPWEP